MSEKPKTPAAHLSRFQPRRFICNFVDGTAEFNDTDCPLAEEYLSIGEHEHLLQESQERERLLTEALEWYANDENYNEEGAPGPGTAEFTDGPQMGRPEYDFDAVDVGGRAREVLAKIRGTNG